MDHMFQLVGRGAPLRALLFVTLAAGLGGCDAADRLTSTSDEPGTTSVEASSAPEAVSFASSSFKGGIPFGVYHLPMAKYGSVYNGSLANISPSELLMYLQAARRSGTRVLLSLPGSEVTFLDSHHHFSMTKWKQRVNRFRGIDFASYVKDGTIIGHYIMDEPHDPSNWGGRVVPLADIEEMARYSKQLWPNMATIVRSSPEYLQGRKFKYLDAAWAQYTSRFGSVQAFIQSYARGARAAGLGLVVGVNQLAGGTKGGPTGFVSGKYAMTASQLESFGSALLNEPHVCAFISWKFDQRYMDRADVRAVLSRLAQKARNHAPKSCRGTASGSAIGEPPPPPPGVKPPATSITLKGSGSIQARRHLTMLRWTGLTGAKVDVYRDGVLVKRTANDRIYANLARFVGRGKVSYKYKVCQAGTSKCSNVVTTSFAN
jgi:hypothetical protein